jgi:hypothetical protein
MKLRTLAPLVRYAGWLAPLAVTLNACNSNSPSTQTFSVSTTTKTSTGTGSTSQLTGGALTLSSAQLVLRKVELAPVSTTCAMETEQEDALRVSADERGGGDDSMEVHDDSMEANDHDEGCEELNVGPLTINLPLDATTPVILDALVPAGTYTGVRAQLGAVNVSGTFTPTGGTGHPFTFASTGHAEVGIRLPTPVTVGATTSNVTITVDVASWFKNDSGAFLDPSDTTNLGAINRNIRRSFRAFGDNDHDGVDDDHGNEHDR